MTPTDDAELERLRAENADLRRRRKNAELAMDKADWGTSTALVEAGRRVLGAIDLDPFSSDYWNYWTVKATTHYTAADDGLSKPWRGRVLVNPPGGKVPGTRKSLVRAAWERLIEHWRRGEVTSAVWVGYSLEQLTTLQNAPMHPLQFWTVVPCERVDFLTQGEGNGPPVPVGSPTHGNYVTFLHDLHNPEVARTQAARFRDEAQRLGGIAGALVRPL
jgi:hypothetical protein